MSRTLYIDCFSGIAGDMMLGALLDLGLPREHLDAQLESLGVDGWQLSVERAKRHGIEGANVQVLTAAPTGQPQRSDADHHHDHHQHGHSHDHDHGHDHDQGADTHPHDHAEHGRRWAEIRTILQASGLTERARGIAERVFERLAVAEGKLHGVPPDEVHFHEVGALDAIVDICGAAIGLDWLAPDRIVAAPVPAPRGFVACAHGTMPLPAPATMELLRGAVLQSVDGVGEWVTPTGAAIVSAVADAYGPIPAMRVLAIGYGVGDRDPPDRANLLRLILGDAPAATAPTDPDGYDLHIQANIDDMSPELFGHVTEQLLGLGVHDVWLTPIQMKKGRPATLLSVLCRASLRTEAVRMILRETTTIGVRVGRVERYKTSREIIRVETPYGSVRVKVARDGDEVVNVAPEYDDCKRLAVDNQIPLKRVLQAAQAAALKSDFALDEPLCPE